MPIIQVKNLAKTYKTIEKEDGLKGYFGLGLVLTVAMLIKLAIPITAILIFKIVFFSIVGASIIGAINTIYSIASFWTYKSNEIIWAFYRVILLLNIQ